jgi:hypothetical protein
MIASFRPQIESLESRELLAADWFSTNIANTAIANLARTDWNNHGAINYNDMLAIYSQVERDGRVDSSEFASLQFLATYGSYVRTPASVCYLESQVVGNNAANRTYLGYSLGNLTVNSASWQLQELVGKWFLGQDRPSVVAGRGLGYVPWGGSLFSSSGPSYADVHQGGAGDCSLLASLAETAARDSGDITNMFTYDGNNVWTVRFFQNGSPVYVTVDNMLPAVSGRTFYDAPQGNLWVALAEKAYAELNAFDGQDGVATSLQGRNSYTSLEGLDPSKVLATLTGRQAYQCYTASSIAQALSQGNLIVLGTGPTTGSPYVVPKHAYAVLGYKDGTGKYTLFNPWGVNGGYYNGYQVYGTFLATASYLEAYCTDAGGWVRTAPGSHTDASAAGLLLTTGGTEKSAFPAVPASRAAVTDAAFSLVSPPPLAPSSAAAVLSAVALPGAAVDLGLTDAVFAQV